VEANGAQVILKGTVRSWAERVEAERVAWAAPGVTLVENKIVVSPERLNSRRRMRVLGCSRSTD
jgi:hypothetical protein